MYHMNPLFLIPLSACIVGSCTLSDWQGQTNMQTIQSVNTSIIMNTSSVSQVLTEAYQEELLAHDIYSYMVRKYPNLTEVKNVIESENTHREQVGNLLDVRGIIRPTEYGIYTETYTTLKDMIDSSLTGAIEVGVMVEIGDIEHLLAEYQKVTDTEVRKVFENIGGGSFNHLRAFLRIAKNIGYVPKAATKMYLTENEISQNGSLKYKMTELLQSSWLPTTGRNQWGNIDSHGKHRKNH